MPDEQYETRKPTVPSMEGGESAHVQIEYVVKTKKRTPLQRVGCAVLIIIWFVIMLIPMALIILAIEGNITVHHGRSVPDRHEHPRLQIRLITELDYRGFQITNSTLDQDSEANLCIQTNVRYILWQGDGEDAQFCDCYSRENPDRDWQFTGTTSGRCEA